MSQDFDLSHQLLTWQSTGGYITVDNVSLYYQVRGSGPWLVCFHGFPTSSWDWQYLLPLLSRHYRVLIFDFPGYGLSGKPTDRSYSLLRQLDAAEALMKAQGIEDFELLAHDMGNSVLCELLYRLEQGSSQFRPKRITLLNGGIYMDLHQPLLTQRLLRIPLLGRLVARFSSWKVFRYQYPKVYAEPEQFDEQHYLDQWALILHNQGRKTLAKVAGYMRERVKRGNRWLGPLERTEIPVHLIWGSKDPIAIPAIANRLVHRHPGIRLSVLDGIGHYPQLEAPEQVAEIMLADSSPS